jgi:hypothetical protein
LAAKYKLHRILGVVQIGVDIAILRISSQNGKGRAYFEDSTFVCAENLSAFLARLTRSRNGERALMFPKKAKATLFKNVAFIYAGDDRILSSAGEILPHTFAFRNI